MERTLHRQLKQHFAGENSEIEVTLGRYRIDIVDGDKLVEVQVSGLSAIRDKIKDLVLNHDVEIIKPVIARKQLIQLTRKNGKEKSRRWSPKRGTRIDIFHELIHFTQVFPHPRLKLTVPLITIEEFRTKPKSRQWRRRKHQSHDQSLLEVVDLFSLRTHQDLADFVPQELRNEFDTGQLAEALEIERWVAQRVAYCLRKTETARVVGKRGNALIYQINKSATSKKSATKKQPAKQRVTKKRATKKRRNGKTAAA